MNVCIEHTCIYIYVHVDSFPVIRTMFFNTRESVDFLCRDSMDTPIASKRIHLRLFRYCTVFLEGVFVSIVSQHCYNPS